jgi:hypothetical protein
VRVAGRIVKIEKDEHACLVVTINLGICNFWDKDEVVVGVYEHAKRLPVLGTVELFVKEEN